jgi:hypothetical protein
MASWGWGHPTCDLPGLKADALMRRGWRCARVGVGDAPAGGIEQVGLGFPPARHDPCAAATAFNAALLISAHQTQPPPARSVCPLPSVRPSLPRSQQVSSGQRSPDAPGAPWTWAPGCPRSGSLIWICRPARLPCRSVGHADCFAFPPLQTLRPSPRPHVVVW